MKNKENILLLLIFFSYILIFRSFFDLSSPLVWGDAPYFYKEGLEALLNFPQTWDYRLNNFGASQHLILWLYIPTFFFGLFDKLVNLNSEILIRLIFYFPATISAIVGAYFFAKRYVQEKGAVLVGTFFYGFNTYFLTLLDGGQIGVALAYGIFPWVIISFLKLFEKLDLKNLLLSTLIFTLITNIDLRIAIISLSMVFLLLFPKLFSKKNLGKFLPFFLVILLVLSLDAFWLVPFIGGGDMNITPPLSALNNKITTLEALVLFNPHFPLNQFGLSSQAPFYFLFLPFLLFGFLFFLKSKRVIYLAILFLLLIFFAKGESPPLGSFYEWTIEKIPLGVAFRDSTKFYIPALLIAASLIGLTIKTLSEKFKKYDFFIKIVILGYLMVLIFPAVSGQLTGVLKGADFNREYAIVYENLKVEKGFLRTLWFPEAPPLTFRGKDRETINANQLYQEKPFASMIIGEYDLFYFLHNKQLPDWFKLLGIKYAFFPESERKKVWTEKEREERITFLNFIENIPGFQRLNWPITFPGYKVSDPLPKIFMQNKIYVVLGGTDIYEKLSLINPDFSVANQGFLFLEDGLWDPKKLLDLPNESLVFITDKDSPNDLAMAFLQDKFIPENKIKENNWGVFTPNQYINWRYELLKHGIKSNDLDYNQNVFFSSIPNEKVSYKIDVQKKDNYYLAFRNIATDSGKLEIKFAGKSYSVEASPSSKFKWMELGPIEINKGDLELSFENIRGFNALNSVTFFSKVDYEGLINTLDEILRRFKGFDLNDPAYQSLIKEDLDKNSPQVISYEAKSQTEYKVDKVNKGWLVFSDHYNSGWEIYGKDTKPYPLYSMINGFYLNSDSSKINLKFKPQEKVELGMKISLFTAGLFVVLVISWIFLRKYKQ